MIKPICALSQRFFGVCLLTALILLVGCAKDPSLSTSDGDMDSGLRITETQASNLVRELLENRPNFSGSPADILIEKVATLSTGDTSNLYLFNFTTAELKAWIVIAGDRRIFPVVAVGDTLHAPPDLLTSEVTQGWFKGVEDEINGIRDGSIKIELPYNLDEVSEICGLIRTSDCGLAARRLDDPGPDPNCTPTREIYGPLLTTEWGQGCPYNRNISRSGCSDECGRSSPPVGCVATAVAQIMRYHRAPASFEFANMINRYSRSSSDVARATRPGNIASLVAIIGIGVKMDYDCDGSGARTQRASDFLKSQGYKSGGTYRKFEKESLRGDIRSGFPIIATGDRKLGVGHAWVIDGFTTSVLASCNGYASYHMNWGWSGVGNGWYGTGDWKANKDPNLDYNRNNDMIVGIRP